MSPRPYRLGQRQAATEKTRARIISAARELLMESTGYAGFSIDAVARQADVARMTVYHQFGSKIGLKAVDILFTLSSFETFDTLAGPTRSMEEVAPLVYRLARAALNLNSA